MDRGPSGCLGKIGLRGCTGGRDTAMGVVNMGGNRSRSRTTETGAGIRRVGGHLSTKREFSSV